MGYRPFEPFKAFGESPLSEAGGMRSAIRNLILFGNSAPPPTTITDALSSDSGLWLDGALSSAAMTIISSKAVWTPTEGAEVNTTGNAASDPNANEANSAAAYTASNTTITAQNTDVNTGLFAVSVVAATTGVNRRANLNITNANRDWYIRRVAAKSISGSWLIYKSGDLFNAQIPITGSYANYVETGLQAADFKEWDIWSNSATAGDTVYFDNLSIKPLTLTSLFRVQRIYYPSTIKADFVQTTFTGCGVVMFKDSSNWVAAIMWAAGAVNKVSLVKCVAGAKTSVNVANITYASGATLQLVPAADMQTWTVKYGAATPLNAQAITDFAASGTWYAGLFNTYNPSDATKVAFTNFSAVALGGATPFS